MNLFSLRQLFPLAIFLVGAGALMGALQWPEPAAFQQISSKVWPIALCCALMAIAIAIVIENLRPRQRKMAVDPLDFDEDVATPGIHGWILVGGMVAAALLLNTFGFWLTLSLLLLALGWRLEHPGRRWRAVATAIILPGAVFALFTYGFNQYLPMGLFE